jgi:hypothetical protein
VQRTPFRPLWTELKGFGSGGTLAARPDGSHNALVRRLIVIALLGALLAALVAGSAHAALGLLFSKTSAEPGDVVFVRTGGNGALLQARRRGETKRWPLRVFMVAKADADSIRSTRDARLTPLGRLTVDPKGNGRLRFDTPNLPPGDYATLIYCRSCVRYSNGRALLPGGPFSRPFRIGPALRSCETSVYGNLPTGWEHNSVRAGPFWLVGVRGYAARAFEPVRPGYYGGVKVLLAVDNGVTATISVPPSERANVTLRYDRALMSGGPWTIRRGRVATTFEACAPGDYPHTQFNGGFLVRGARCAHLEISVQGRPEPMQVAIPFGAAC